MQSISVFLDITKVANLRRKYANVSRTQGMCLVIFFIFYFWIFRQSITVPSFIIVGYV